LSRLQAPPISGHIAAGPFQLSWSSESQATARPVNDIAMDQIGCEVKALIVIEENEARLKLSFFMKLE